MTKVRMTVHCKEDDWPSLPRKLQVDLVGELDMLTLNPQIGKPLWENLRRYRAIRMGRYRIIYRYDQKTDTAWVVALGIRREGSRDDVYEKASRLTRTDRLGPP